MTGLPSMPDGYTFTYYVPAEAWYADTLGRIRDDEVCVSAAAETGGVAWEFAFKMAEHGLRIEMFNDAFSCFAHVPELFTALADEQPTTLADVRAILDRLGATDSTPRVKPS